MQGHKQTPCIKSSEQACNCVAKSYCTAQVGITLLLLHDFIDEIPSDWFLNRTSLEQLAKGSFEQNPSQLYMSKVGERGWFVLMKQLIDGLMT